MLFECTEVTLTLISSVADLQRTSRAEPWTKFGVGFDAPAIWSASVSTICDTTFAGVEAAGGLSLPIIGALLGHKHTATTARYAHLAADPLRAANEAVGERIAAALAKRSPPV